MEQLIFPILAGVVAGFVIFILPLILISRWVGDVKKTKGDAHGRQGNYRKFRLRPEWKPS